MRVVGWIVVLGLIVVLIAWIFGWVSFSTVEGGTRRGFSVEFDQENFEQDADKARRGIEELGEEPNEPPATPETETAVASVEGELVAVDPEQRTVDVRGATGEVKTWSLSEQPELMLGGEPSTLTALRAGDTVVLSVRGGRVQRLRATR